MKNWILILLILPMFSYGQQTNENLVEDVKNITGLPYIGKYGGVGCGDDIFWKLVEKKLEIVPLLIEKMNDTTKISVFVPNFGGKYTVADAAYLIISEIIKEIPTFELLGVEFDNEECGYCSYWFHLRSNIMNRNKFQKALSKWYGKNMKKLIWIEDNQILTGDCSGEHPNGGHYKVKK